MAKKDRTLPYFLGRFNYWSLHIAAPFRTPEAWGPQPPASALESQADTIEHVLAILEEQSSPGAPDPRSAHERHVQALTYWISLDRLWYQFPLAQDLLDTLPARQKHALDTLSHQLWAPKRSRWTWETLLPRIARDQRIFRRVVELGPTRAGVAYGSDRAIAPTLFKETQAAAHKLYVEYHRQASLLLAPGAPPHEDLAAWLRDAGALNQCGRLPTDSVLADMEDVYHLFAHALRNLARYRNSHPPLPWPENPTSCARACQRELEKLAR